MFCHHLIPCKTASLSSDGPAFVACRVTVNVRLYLPLPLWVWLCLAGQTDSVVSVSSSDLERRRRERKNIARELLETEDKWDRYTCTLALHIRHAYIYISLYRVSQSVYDIQSLASATTTKDGSSFSLFCSFVFFSHAFLFFRL